MQETTEEDWLDETVWICPKCGNTGNWREGDDYEIWYLDCSEDNIVEIVCCKCWYSEKMKEVEK